MKLSPRQADIERQIFLADWLLDIRFHELDRDYEFAGLMADDMFQRDTLLIVRSPDPFIDELFSDAGAYLGAAPSFTTVRIRTPEDAAFGYFAEGN